MNSFAMTNVLSDFDDGPWLIRRTETRVAASSDLEDGPFDTGLIRG